MENSLKIYCLIINQRKLRQNYFSNVNILAGLFSGKMSLQIDFRERAEGRYLLRFFNTDAFSSSMILLLLILFLLLWLSIIASKVTFNEELNSVPINPQLFLKVPVETWLFISNADMYVWSFHRLHCCYKPKLQQLFSVCIYTNTNVANLLRNIYGFTVIFKCSKCS